MSICHCIIRKHLSDVERENCYIPHDGGKEQLALFENGKEIMGLARV
jgi:hypothetical protein